MTRLIDDVQCACRRWLVRPRDQGRYAKGPLTHRDDPNLLACLPWFGTRGHESHACGACGMDFIIVLTPEQDIEFSRLLEEYVRRTVEPHAGYTGFNAEGLKEEYWSLLHLYGSHMHVQGVLGGHRAAS